MLKNSVTSIVSFLTVLCMLLMGGGVLADTADNSSLGRVASEYLSENMYKDFEQTDQSLPVAAPGTPLSLSCSSAILMEKTTKTVLYEHNSDELRAPASITKVMTMLLVCEAIEEGKLSLEDIVTTSSHARSKGGSQIWLEDGEQMSVNDLLKAVAVASANDAATALAEHISGSEESFVVLMNERAKELGMNDTTFVNCCGLDAEGHLTTARDIAIMSCELLKHDIIRQYTQIWIDYLRGGETQLVNTNKLVRFFNGCTGLKTGTTDDAGFCVSASAERDGMEVVAVVLNGSTSDLRFSDAKTLINYGFANYSVTSVNTADIELLPVKVTHGVASDVGVQCEKSPDFVLPKSAAGAIQYTVNLPSETEAPVQKGQILGSITYTCENKEIGKSTIYACEDVAKIDFFTALKRIFVSMFRL